MKKQQGFTSVEMVIVAFVILVMAGWVWNALKLFSCDFESSYKCEVVHAVGVFVPPFSLVTVWFGSDE